MDSVIDPTSSISAHLVFLKENVRIKVNECEQLEKELALVQQRYAAVVKENEQLAHKNDLLLAEIAIEEGVRHNNQSICQQKREELHSLEYEIKVLTHQINKKKTDLSTKQRMTSLYNDKMMNHERKITEKQIDDPNLSQLEEINKQVDRLSYKYECMQTSLQTLLTQLGDHLPFESFEEKLLEKERHLAKLKETLTEREEKLQDKTTEKQQLETTLAILKKKKTAQLTRQTRLLEQERENVAGLHESIKRDTEKIAEIKKELGIPLDQEYPH